MGRIDVGWSLFLHSSFSVTNYCKRMVHSADSLCTKVEQSLCIYLLSEQSETFPLQGEISSWWTLTGQTDGKLYLTLPQWHGAGKETNSVSKNESPGLETGKAWMALQVRVSPLCVYALWFSLIAYLHPILYHYLNTIILFSLVLVIYFSLM